MKKIMALLALLPLAGCDFGKQTVYVVQTMSCNNAMENWAKSATYFSDFKEAEKRASAMKLSCESVAFAQVVSDNGSIDIYQFFDWHKPASITFTSSHIR